MTIPPFTLPVSDAASIACGMFCCPANFSPYHVGSNSPPWQLTNINGALSCALVHEGPSVGQVCTAPAAPPIAEIDVCVDRRHVSVEMANTASGRGAVSDFHLLALWSNPITYAGSVAPMRSGSRLTTRVGPLYEA